jgi:ABC-type lipoprotein export system ATPase subunit
VNLVANNLCFKGYKGIEINDVNIELNTGQCLIITGISGSGKSLLLSLICGLVRADSGSVRFDGLTMQQMTAKEDASFRKGLGVVFQKPALLSNLTISENLLLPLIQHYPDLSENERAAIVEDACHRFELQRYIHDRIEDLSNGIQSLISLTRALIVEPDLLIWDAPSSDIDMNLGGQILNILKQMKIQGKTIILFTNRKVLIDEMADVHLHLVDGKLVSGDATRSVNDKPEGLSF